MLQLAVVSGTWKQDRINAWATPYEMYNFDLSYSILHNTTPQRSAAFYRDVLSSAPCEGPYNLQDKNGNRVYDPEWNENSRWSHPFGPSNQTFGEYNGNDYMLLYNLYRLAFKSIPDLPAYKDKSCPCTNSNYVLEANLSSNILSKNITLQRKFPDYTNIGIYLKEYLNHPLTISSTGILNIKTDLVVCNNSTLDVTALGSVVVGDGVVPSKLIVRKGSSLILRGNGNLKVLDKSSVVIEEGGSIVYQQGAKLLLAGDNSVLELQGDLVLENADFVFNYTLGNKGYLKFSKPGFPSKNLVMKGICSMSFTGYNNTDKVMEISQETLYLPSGLKSLMVKNAQVSLYGNSRLSAPCPLLFSGSRLTSASGQKNGHRGLEIYGQAGVTISGSIFEYGGTGLNAILFYNGNSLSLNGCSFLNNDAGLVTYGKGVSLQNCFFTNNQAFGWKADGLEFSSKATSCEFTYNSTSGIFLFSSPVKVDLTDCRVNYNEIGIITEGSSILNMKCGEVKKNRKDGFLMMNNATLSMSTSLGGGYVNASGNGSQGGLTINMDGANMLYLDRGFNDLTLDAGQTSKCITNGLGCRVLIDGTINLNACNGSPAIAASYNVWDNIYPYYFSDLRLNGLSTSAVCNGVQPHVILKDQFPGSKAPCDLYNQDPCVINPGSCPTNFLTTCSDCSTISTTSFGAVKVNKAVQNASGNMSPSVTDGYKTAVSQFSEILNNPDNDNKPQETTVMRYGEKKMKESLASAVENGQIHAGNTNAPEVQKTLAMLNKVINKSAKKPDAYTRKLYSFVEKATIYRLLGRRDLAIATLDSTLTWVEPDQKDYISRWRCLINAEDMLVTNQVEKEEFESLIASCGIFSYRKRPAKTSEEDAVTNEADLVLSVYPNPSQDGIFFLYFSEKPLEGKWGVHLYDVLGNVLREISVIENAEIDISDQPYGIYFIRAENGEGQSLVKKVLYMGE